MKNHRILLALIQSIVSKVLMELEPQEELFGEEVLTKNTSSAQCGTTSFMEIVAMTYCTALKVMIRSSVHMARTNYSVTKVMTQFSSEIKSL